MARETARVVYHVCGTPAGLAEYDAAICCWPGLEEEARRLREERLAKCTHHSEPSVAASATATSRWSPTSRILRSNWAKSTVSWGPRGRRSVPIRICFEHPNHRDAQVALQGKCLDLWPEAVYRLPFRPTSVGETG